MMTRPEDDKAPGRLRNSKLFWCGLILFVLGCGPLLAVILLASLGLTDDPNPNPVGFGIMALLTFWPSLILMAVAIYQSKRRKRPGGRSGNQIR